MKKIFLLAALIVSIHSIHPTDIFDTPGRYAYGSDVFYSPTSDNEAAISIESSNIVIDLAGRTVVIDPTTTFTGTVAIKVAPNLSNVVIQNGTIIGMNKGVGINVGDGCAQIYIQDLAVRTCNDTAVFCDGNTTGITNVQIANCSFVFTRSTAVAYGIHLLGCANIGIDYCQCIGTISTGTAAYGVRLDSCSGSFISNCNFVQTSAPVTSAGVSFSATTNGIIQSCRMFNNVSTTAAAGAGAYGLLLDSACQKNRIIDCILASNSNALAESAAVKSIGGTQNIIENCALEFSAGSSVSAGVIFDGESQSHVQDSKISGNSASVGTAYGILLRNTNTDCYIADNIITSTDGVGGSSGITDEQTPSTNCIIQNSGFNNGTNYTVTYPTGITLPVVDGSLSSVSPGMPNSDNWNNISINP